MGVPSEVKHQSGMMWAVIAMVVQLINLFVDMRVQKKQSKHGTGGLQMNKPRLIDANEWIKELRINPATNVLDRFVNERIICLLEKRPTAYDIDKVVEQLEETSVTYCKEYGYSEDENVLYLPDAIEIVKGVQIDN
jgi:hypothetical protein